MGVLAAVSAAEDERADTPPQAGGIVEGPTGQALHELLVKAEGDGYSGAALVAIQGNVVLSRGYGTANRAEAKPYSAGTVFSIGSITKQFTAAAILKLEEEGRLSVMDAIGEYFPEAPDDKRDITIHELLTHSSGLPSDVGGDYARYTTAKFLDRVFRTKRIVREGESPFHYSNIGYSLLGIAIERITGVSYEAYLADRFFQRLGMNKTGYVLPDWSGESVAIGYDKKGKPWGSPLDKPWSDDGPYWGLKGNGGMLSTLGDMHRWISALRNGQALSETSLSKLWTGYEVDAPDVTPPPMYAYGWRIITTKYGKRLISHNGSNGIFFASVRIFPEDDIVLILASNTEGNECWRYEQPGMWRILFGS